MEVPQFDLAGLVNNSSISDLMLNNNDSYNAGLNLFSQFTRLNFTRLDTSYNLLKNFSYPGNSSEFDSSFGNDDLDTDINTDLAFDVLRPALNESFSFVLENLSNSSVGEIG